MKGLLASIGVGVGGAVWAQGAEAACRPGGRLCGLNSATGQPNDAICCSNECLTPGEYANSLGRYRCRCDEPLTNCGSRCIDTSGDPDNCGACGNECDPGADCVEGTCTCAGGGVIGDDENCSACGDACDTYAGETCCSNQCVVLGTTTNCLSCGDACGQDEECCNSGCTDTSSDENQCGACAEDQGAPCSSYGGEECCNGVCTDTLSDESNCGACADEGGEVCGQTETCCNGSCLDTDSDLNNCGGCAGSGGTDCTTLGFTDAACCSGTCVDLDDDPDNCGACGGTPADQYNGEVCCGGAIVQLGADTNCASCGDDCTTTGEICCNCPLATDVCATFADCESGSACGT